MPKSPYISNWKLRKYRGKELELCMCTNEPSHVSVWQLKCEWSPDGRTDKSAKPTKDIASKGQWDVETRN